MFVIASSNSMPSLLALTLTSAILSASVAAPTSASPSLDPSHPEAIKRVFGTQCGACHFSSSPTANTAALGVFDLDARDWLSQLLRNPESVLERLEARQNMSR